MKLICIKCPRGCEININGDSITGNACPRGLDYAKEELSTPMRIVTSLVKSKYGVIPVKTNREVPKKMIFEVLNEISNLQLNKTKIGDVIIKNVLNTGADVVVTGNPYNKDN